MSTSSMRSSSMLNDEVSDIGDDIRMGDGIGDLTNGSCAVDVVAVDDAVGAVLAAMDDG